MIPNSSPAAVYGRTAQPDPRDPEPAIPYPFLNLTHHRAGAPDRRDVLINLIVAAAYALTGHAGLQIAFVGHAVTLFWPPSGIAFAAVWLGGTRLLPGVMLGAFAVNASALGSPTLALLIAIGNAVPSLIATTALRRGFIRHPAASEMRRVVLFIAIAVLASTTASATVGAATVHAAGGIDDSFAATWVVWWLGDAMGVLIVAPPILLWQRLRHAGFSGRVAAEAAGFTIAGGALIGGMLLLDGPVWAVELCKLGTVLISMGTGSRFGLAGPAFITLLTAFGVIGITLDGAGPFVRGDFIDTFAFVHAHLFAQAIAGMLLAASMTDLRRTAVREAQQRAKAEIASIDRIRLLTMISHDVRVPLAGVLGVLQTLSRLCPTPEPARLIELGLRTGQTLVKLVTDILDVSRAEAGRIALERAPFSPARSLRDIVDLLQDQAAAKSLELRLSGTGALPSRVIGDRVRFEQLLGNLAVNAVAYTAAGHVHLIAAWDAEASAITVCIDDTGGGIEPTRLAALFDADAPDAPPDGRSAGLGLGLHICRRLAVLMNGEVGHMPLPGGSRFRVRLPLPSHDMTPDPAKPGAATGEAGQSILLIDDDVVAGEVTTALLRSHGHRVTFVSSAETALAVAEDGSFDLILLDIMLSHGTCGLMLAQRLRALPGPAGQARIVALTADGSQVPQAAALDGVIVKPLMLDRGLEAALEIAARPAASISD